MRSTAPLPLIVLTAIVLAGCGGGDSSDKAPTATANATPSDVSMAASAASAAASAVLLAGEGAASAPAAQVGAVAVNGAVRLAGSTSNGTAGGSASSVAGAAVTAAPTAATALPAATTAAASADGTGLPALPEEPLAKATAVGAAMSAPGTGLTALVALGNWATMTAAKAATTARTSSTVIAPPGVSAADVIARVAGGTAAPQSAIGLQCQGTNSDLSASNAVFAVAAGTNTRVQRFGTATAGADPVYRLEVGNTDELAAGAPPRCENLVFPSATTGIKQGELFWHAIEIWADDWANTADDQLILQWHQNDARLSLNPMLAFVLRGNQLRAEMLTSAANPATRSTYVAATSTLPGWKPRQWNTLVIQGRISPLSSQAPLLRVWLNNQLVIDRNQPIGFQLQTGAYNYVKWGIYKWTNGNPWNPLYANRSVMVKNMLLVRDPRAGYTNSVITTALTSTLKTQ